MGSPFALKHRRNPMAIALQSTLAPEMPSVSSLRDQASKIGKLKKLSGKGILTSGTWRERYCLLVKSKLYYYESEDSLGTEKSCGCVNLEYFNTCTEATTRMARKATNVFVIGSDKGFFDSHSGRHYFAAETLPEMKDWVNSINAVMKNHTRVKEKRTTRDGSLTPGQTKRDSSKKMKGKEVGDDAESLPRSDDNRLDHVTKSRVRGPQGRRLPRKPHRQHNGSESKADSAIMDSDEETAAVRNGAPPPAGRATSLSALNIGSESHKTRNEEQHIWAKADIVREVDGTGTPEIELIYDYSSSDSNDNESCTSRQSNGSIYVQRRSVSRSGSRGRNSSITPPPCVQRRNRRTQEPSIGALPHNPQKLTTSSRPINNTVILPPEMGTLHRTSSGSSLSTLMADTYAPVMNGHPNGGPFLSLQRGKDKQLGNGNVPSASSGQNIKPPLIHHHRQSSSVNGSPLMSNGLRHNMMPQQHKRIQKSGYVSHNASPTNTFERNNYSLNNNGIHLERNIFSLNKDLDSISQEAKQLDIDVTSLRQDIGTVQENIVSVRGAVDQTKEKLNKLQAHVNHVEKQVASIIQETNVMKDETRGILESAKSAKEVQGSLLEEAQQLVGFLRQNMNCAPSSPFLHQHFNGHFGQPPYYSNSPCGTPVPPCCAHPMPQQSPQMQMSLRRRGKTPERSTMGDVADGVVVPDMAPNEYFDMVKPRHTKSALSNSSSGSGGSNGGGNGNHNHRASMLEPFDRRSNCVSTRSPLSVRNANESNKVSHL